ITNTYVSPKTEVTGTKVWVNGPEVKPNIMLQLFRDGEAHLEPVELVDGETVYTWTELDKTDLNGVDYVYTVDEVSVPKNYEKSIEDYTITNTYVIPKTDIKVYKSWVNGPILKPSIEIQLYRDGEPMGDPVVLDDGVFEYTWTDMDATDIDGNVYVYTVDEINVPENYEKDITDFVIVNTYLSPKTTVRADKIWDGGPKPQIEIQLFRNGEAYGDPVVLNEGVTSYLWEDLELTDIYGELYVYTVDELNVPEDYVKHISEDGLTITNTFVEPELPSTGSSQAHVYMSMGLIAMGMLFMVIPRRRKE
ncbi:MAG: Cna B-type domain-containing protein, partial [Erysipelothrix sp.]|nr:Cna B-type domain-containing protein [Erysipelothrix sp.]